ncbi:hypothetical protein NDU88_003844 [Pleurodeles waltl]|uniref:Uncharacterized protein n=1 Tax=Pleurodeles waltl TaxID=8319 RepID=A0AAV7V163_PLEWA|nr:hypothetical protein NDU88_003844 [Pleurodeles waltl]
MAAGGAGDASFNAKYRRSLAAAPLPATELSKGGGPARGTAMRHRAHGASVGVYGSTSQPEIANLVSRLTICASVLRCWRLTTKFFRFQIASAERFEMCIRKLSKTCILSTRPRALVTDSTALRVCAVSRC